MKLPTKLETERMIIRPYIDRDWEYFLEFMLCSQVTDYLDFSEEQKTKAGAKELFEMTLNSYLTSEPLFALVIAQKDSDHAVTGLPDRFIGSCGFSPLDESQSCECFYALLPEYWGQGLATEAMNQLLNYGFTELKIKRVTARINNNNPASFNVATKLGMTDLGFIDFKDVSHQGRLLSLNQVEYAQRLLL